MNRTAPAAFRRRIITAGALTAAAALAFTGCASGGSASGADAGGDEPIGVSLIVKTTSNPFFVAMQDGAEAAAEDLGVELTMAAGKEDGDEDTQIQAIENAISKGDAGILITPNGPAVEDALVKARDAGLYVIALDTPPDPANTVDITFATDNFKAGKLIGQWAQVQMAGKPATIAMLDLFNDKVVSVDYNRDQGFLTGMGIPVGDPKKNGDEAKTGSYTGGTYTIVCNEAGNGAADGGRSAMERCLTKNPDINLVYTINEPTAVGANAALKAAGKTATIVSIDGGCAGVAAVKSGVIGATAQQYPLKMAELGIQAIAQIATGGAKPSNSPGLDFYDTGVALVTDKKAGDITIVSSDDGSKICWGSAS